MLDQVLLPSIIYGQLEEEDFETFQQHEQNRTSQELFKKHAGLIHFKDDGPELLVLESRSCASADLIDTEQNIKATGLIQYQHYVADVVIGRKSSINKPIKKNHLPIFKRLQE